MSILIYTESNLYFEFNPAWKVIKLDEHRFYSYLSGYNMSGVDFIVYNETEVILIEIKNYKKAKPRDIDLKTILPALAEKLKDSVALIELVNRFYQKKIGVRLINPLLKRLPNLKYHFFPWMHIADSIARGSVKSIFLLDALALGDEKRQSWTTSLSDSIGHTVKISSKSDDYTALKEICTIQSMDQARL